jgi:predicted nucleic acid-binding Zn ribbon protein
MKRLWKTTMFGSALRNAIEQHGLERGIREQDLFQRWEEIVGPAIARQATPNRLRNGLLWLHVVDSAWRQELSLMRRELVAKINAALGEELVKDIRLR